MKFTTYLSAILLTSALAACQVTVETDDPYDGSSGGLQIDAGSFTMGLDKARNFDVDGGNNGVIWGTFTGTGQPVCFVVDADADFVMTVGRESKWYAPDFDGSDTGSFDQEDCSQYSSGNEPAFCWFRTQQDISYVMQVSRYYSTETTSWATVAVVDGPCPAEVDEAVFTYDEEASGSSNFENHQVEAITLTEGMSGIATATFDAEGRDVEGGFSATFMSTGGPVCFAMDSDVGNNIIVAEKSRLDDNPYPDSATVGSVEAVHIECKHYSSGSTSEPAFCGLADTSAGKEYIVLAESYYSSETKMMASLAAISGPCPYVIDEAVFTFDEESSGSNVFENYQVAEGDITGFGENFAIEETLDAEGFSGGDRVRGGISATFTAAASGSVCFVTDCDLNCEVTVAKESSLTEQPSPISVGTFGTNLCYDYGSGTGPGFCSFSVTSGETYRILGESYYDTTTSINMVVGVFEGDCSAITESSLMYDE